MYDWGNLEGLIPLGGGVYCYLLANGTLPRHPKDPERVALWRRKFGTMMKVCAPVCVIFGLLRLLGVVH